MTSRPKRVLSGMQPSGLMHLGNYLGALENWKQLQTDYECYFFVADWHALSTNYADTGRIREFVRELLIDWLAAGIDPDRSIVFIQSRVPEHAILHLLLSMMVPVSWLERNPTYKEKQEEIKEKDLSTYGFLGYPVLQAADILLYKPDFVPVGKDQLPHLELTREIARRFNDLYKQPVFPEPKEHLTKFPKVPGTDGRKMSKSYGNTINLSDTEPVVRQKLKTMITDPARVRRFDPGNPDVCPVFDFHKMFSPLPVIERVNRECRTAEIGCIDCKKLVADRIVETLAPIWEARAALVANPSRINDIVHEGSRKAGMVANATLQEVTLNRRRGGSANDETVGVHRDARRARCRNRPGSESSLRRLPACEAAALHGNLEGSLSRGRADDRGIRLATAETPGGRQDHGPTASCSKHGLHQTLH
jgi:tryptophanyl-tRNA synthetase